MIPLTVPLGRSERRVSAACYVQGLLMPGQRKSIEPIAARLGVDSQRLQQFMADSPWEETQLWRVIRQTGQAFGRSRSSVLRGCWQAGQLSS